MSKLVKLGEESNVKKEIVKFVSCKIKDEIFVENMPILELYPLTAKILVRSKTPDNGLFCIKN